MPKELYSLVELAGILQYPYSTLYRLAICGRIPNERVGKACIVKASDLQEIKDKIAAFEAAKASLKWKPTK
ncbi:hypothetical protein J8F10_19465 [Gemmata sp. G18]|uniref:DNA-binding protein n=1 Tax=Gemmata palustris TaxID=2822762 RepID=A0ABS5BUT8_9BACT|nr:hypothetical protein [Gemmata palustris]MBP3957431.1 hypothetical protein [Gemmata palustris]